MESTVDDSYRRWKELSEEEKKYYRITSKAFSKLLSRTNSDLINSNWHSELYDTLDDLDYYPEI